jgi:CBS domain-containing protein
MKLSEIITPKPQCIAPDATLTEAAAAMKSMDVGVLPVCLNDRLIGTITDRDITIRAVAEGHDPKSIKVEAVMSREIIYCYNDQDIKDAAEIMKQGQLRRLPVLNRDNLLVGIVTLGDLANRTTEVGLAGKVLARVTST